MQHILEGTTFLMEEVIPSMLNDLSLRDYVIPLSQGLGININQEFHSRGINIRSVISLSPHTYHLSLTSLSPLSFT